MAGAMNKDRETWDYVNKFDIVGLTETWVKKENWIRIKDKMSNGMNWRYNAATREFKKGRAKGGIITGINERIKQVGYEEWNENIVERRIKHKDEEWRIVVVYSKNLK